MKIFKKTFTVATVTEKKEYFWAKNAVYYGKDTDFELLRVAKLGHKYECSCAINPKKN